MSVTDQAWLFCSITRLDDSSANWQFCVFGGTVGTVSWRRLQISLLSLVATACSIGNGLGNLAHDLGKHDYHGFEPTQQLVAKGNYDHLKIIDWSSSRTRYIVARHIDATNTTIALRSLDGSAACDVPGTDFNIYWPGTDSNGIIVDPSGEIVVLDDPDGDGIGTLAFYDRACVQLGDSFADAALPVANYYHDRFLVRSGSRLLAVEPRVVSVNVLAENLEHIDSRTSLGLDGVVYHPYPYWFIDGGQFAALDDSGHVTFRRGSQVTEAVGVGGPGSVDSPDTDYMLTDGGQLLWATATQTITVATDICGLRAVGAMYFEYRAPCAGGPMKVALFNGSVLVSATIDATADHVLAFDGNFTNPTAFFTRAPADGTYGKELWFRSNGGAPQQLVRGVAWAEAGIGSPPDAGIYGQLEAIVDSDGVSGRLVECNSHWNLQSADGGLENADQRLLTQAESVPVTPLPNPDFYQLANYDGNVGDFIDPFPSGVAIAQGVPADLGAYNNQNNSYRLLLANYASGKGRLGMMLTNPTYTTTNTKSDAGLAGASLVAIPRSIQWIADDVGLATFQLYYDKMHALGYIDQWDVGRGAGRFVVHDVDLDMDYFLADAVREQFGIIWPWVGVIFAVADGQRQGIWAARASN